MLLDSKITTKVAANAIISFVDILKFWILDNGGLN